MIQYLDMEVTTTYGVGIKGIGYWEVTVMTRSSANMAMILYLAKMIMIIYMVALEMMRYTEGGGVIACLVKKVMIHYGDSMETVMK